MVTGSENIELLGSAIYFRWKSYHDRETGREEILSPDTRNWFILIFNRIRMLVTENPSYFKGQIEKIELWSNAEGFGPCPQPEEEIEQYLILRADGTGSLSGYGYGKGKNKLIKSRSLQLNLAVASQILNYFTLYFSGNRKELECTDVGSWNLKMTNSEGKIYRYHGALAKGLSKELEYISNKMRKELCIDLLFAFDGAPRLLAIRKITVDYQRTTILDEVTTVDEFEEEETKEEKTRTIREFLRVDGVSHNIKYMQEINGINCITMEYKAGIAVSLLLEGFAQTNLFHQSIDSTEAMVKNPKDIRKYHIIVDYEKGRQQTWEGIFDLEGLPADWEWFIGCIAKAMSLYTTGEIFTPNIFNKRRRKKNDYIYCSVFFMNGGRVYYYRTDDDTIESGDFVMVPTGMDNKEQKALVEKVEYFAEKDVPYPLSKTKKIIRKCDDSEEL